MPTFHWPGTALEGYSAGNRERIPVPCPATRICEPARVIHILTPHLIGEITGTPDPAVVDAAKPLEKRIRTQLERHLGSLGFTVGDDGNLRLESLGKDAIRAVHEAQRSERLRENAEFVRARGADLLQAFADGEQIKPDAIRPQLQLIEADSWESDLFRLASLLWSVPVSRGYGRRLRFLVWDRSNNKLLGLIALGDPSFNLAARDRVVGWTSAERAERLVHVMDAFVLGAVPPYNFLLGGKLIASLVRSRDIVRHFREHYRHRVGTISKKRKEATLVAVTTSSALGRSSIYNRLRLEGANQFEPIGYTGGWGHFHVPRDLFEDMRRFLTLRKHPYSRNYEFGDGPNWRLRTIRAALDLLGYDVDLLRHGVQRQVYITWVASNGLKILRGEAIRPRYRDLLPASAVGRLARDRWMVPRAERDRSYCDWRRSGLLVQLDWRAVDVDEAVALNPGQ